MAPRAVPSSRSSRADLIRGYLAFMSPSCSVWSHAPFIRDCANFAATLVGTARLAVSNLVPLLALNLYPSACLPAVLARPSSQDHQKPPLCAYHTVPSNMFRTPNRLPPNLRPINTLLHLLIHKPTNHHIVSPHKIQPMRLLCARFLIIHTPDDSLDGVLQDEIGHLVARDEGAG
jgi:hypothetical protein